MEWKLMIYFDAHCDAILEIHFKKCDLLENNCHVDLKRLKGSGNFIQTFAVFVDPDQCKSMEFQSAVEMIDTFFQMEDKYKDRIALCRNYNEIISTLEQGKTAAMLSIENGGALQGRLSNLRTFYRLGVRSICLTWNNRNEIADGVGEQDGGGGLSSFGRAVIEEMDRLGMIIDVSHMSEKGFYDVMAASQNPVIASHSNAKAICRHKRNLTDSQILAIKLKGGVIGVNFCPDFLNDSGCASLDDVIRHIEYISSLAGPEYVGLGADFDGIEATPEGIDGVQDIYKVIDRLAVLNYPQKTIEDIAGGNFLRVVKDVTA
jgi:membrane dipeptidase